MKSPDFVEICKDCQQQKVKYVKSFNVNVILIFTIYNFDHLYVNIHKCDSLILILFATSVEKHCIGMMTQLYCKERQWFFFKLILCFRGYFAFTRFYTSFTYRA